MSDLNTGRSDTIGGSFTFSSRTNGFQVLLRKSSKVVGFLVVGIVLEKEIDHRRDTSFTYKTWTQTGDVLANRSLRGTDKKSTECGSTEESVKES